MAETTDTTYPAKFRMYEKEFDELWVPEATVMNGEGVFFELGAKDDPNCGEIHPTYWPSDEDDIEFEVSWFTGWTDRNGDEIFGGDILKRVRHMAAEHEREWIEEHEDSPDVDDIESFVTDYSGSLGVVEWSPGGFSIRLIEGHKWAFHGPEGTLDSRFDKEIEIVGNKWQNKDLLE